MEMIGHEPNRSYGTLHFGPGPESTQLGRYYTLPSVFSMMSSMSFP
jgi:hypothetical protein